MEQNKLENEFRTKLNAREIEPSAQAWDRLDAMLTVGEQKKVPVRKLNWLYIAAGILGFLFIGLMFYNNQGTTGETENAVAVEEKASGKNTESNRNDGQAGQNQIHPVKDILLEQVPVQKSESVAASTIRKNTNRSDPKQNRAFDKKAPVQKQEEALAVSETYQNRNNENNQTITPVKTNANVDELLASATQESTAKKPGLKVDAGALLSQVDGELELSFREKAIKTLGKKYQNVKVALGNRNTQE